uniref:Protein quiver n=1 Tax=Setaria digitata TaxID=48799 RepID=A0A915PS26_9BILA
MKVVVYLMIFTPTMAFQCFQCNSGVDEDDTKPCIDQEAECPKGVRSCSMIMYGSSEDDEVHVRKFCSSPNTPLSQYLRFFPNGAMCQNIFTNRGRVRFASLLERRRREALPPAPPIQYKDNLLCVCTASLCNGGIHKEVIGKIVSNPLRRDIKAKLFLHDLDH